MDLAKVLDKNDEDVTDGRSLGAKDLGKVEGASWEEVRPKDVDPAGNVDVDGRLEVNVWEECSSFRMAK